VQIRVPTHLTKHFEAVHPRHVEVGQHEIGSKARQEGVEDVLIKSEVTVAAFKSVISNALG